MDDEEITLEMTREEVAALILVIRMSGYHRRKEYPENMRSTDSRIAKLMSKILKRLESA